jgi:hypothetical protein
MENLLLSPGGICIGVGDGLLGRDLIDRGPIS